MHWQCCLWVCMTVMGGGLAACQPAQQPPDTIRLPNGNFRDHVDTSKPLRFHRYHLGTACYDTYDCRIKYGDGFGNGYIVHDDPDNTALVAMAHA